MSERQVDPNDAEMNHEAIVADFFASEEPSDAPESDPEPVEDESPSEDPEVAEDAAEEDEEEADDEPSGEEEALDAPDLDTNVHPSELARREQQSVYDRKLAEVQGQLEQMNQWAQTVYQQQLAAAQAQTAAQQAQAQQAPAMQSVSREQLEAAVEQNLTSAFQWTVANRSDLVPSTIAIAREKYGNEVGDQMQVEYNDYKLAQFEQRQQAALEAQHQSQVERDAPAQIEATMQEIVSSVADQYGDAFIAVQDDFIARTKENVPHFKAYMDQKGYDMTPDAVRSFLVQTLNDVREERLNAAAAKPRKPRAVKPSEHVETSSSGDGLRPEDMTADEFAINEILQGARSLEMDVTPPVR